jgi:hypothetical protein
MDASLSAVIVSLITGSFGVLGILATQWAAKHKTRNIKPDARDVMAASEREEQLPRIDYLATIKQDIRQNRSIAREGILDIREDLHEIKADIKVIKKRGEH